MFFKKVFSKVLFIRKSTFYKVLVVFIGLQTQSFPSKPIKSIIMNIIINIICNRFFSVMHRTNQIINNHLV